MPTATADAGQPTMPGGAATIIGARRARDRHDDAFERRLNEAETAAVEWMRDMRHRSTQARRVVTKKSGEWKRKPMRTTVGMAGRVAGVGVAGGYLAARTTIKSSRRGYQRAAPHVRRVAGTAARAAHVAHSHATVYGNHYATAARRATLRAVARHRVAGRQRERLRRDPLLHAAMVANGQMSTRSMSTARRAAGLLSPQAKRTSERARRRRTIAGRRNTPAATPAQDRDAIRRADGVRRNPHNPIRPQEGGDWAYGLIDAYPSNSAPKRILNAAKVPPPKSGRSTKTQPPPTNHFGQKGNNMAVSTQSSTNPAAVMESGFKLAGEFQPISWIDWMQQIRSQAGAFRQASQSYLQLAVTMDLQRRMDPRALVGLYVVSAAMGQTADVMISTANQFWLLYQDRIEKNGRGRTMNNEHEFFG